MKKFINARHAFAVGVALFTLVAIMPAATSKAHGGPSSCSQGPATFTTLLKFPLPTVGLAGGSDGKLYTAGRTIGGNPCPVWRIDPGSPSLVEVGQIPAASTGRCIANGLDTAGDLFVAEADSGHVYKLTPNETPPLPMAIVFGNSGAGGPGALAIAFDKHGSLWVTEGVVSPIQGRVWKIIPPTGGVKVEQFRIPPLLNTQSVGQDVRRTVGLVNPPGFTSAGLSVATGIAFNQNGDLLISDLSRKAIWKVEFNPDGSLKSPIGCDTTYHPKTLCLSNVFIQHPLLGAQIALDTFGNIWSGVPDRNAIAVVTTCGNVEEIFRNPVNSFHRRNAADTDNTRILEFPNSPVLLDKRFCVSNFDEDIQDNSPNIAGELNPIAGPRGKISCMDQDLYVPGIPLPVK
jgi:hypothetical protein